MSSFEEQIKLGEALSASLALQKEADDVALAEAESLADFVAKKNVEAAENVAAVQAAIQAADQKNKVMVFVARLVTCLYHLCVSKKPQLASWEYWALLALCVRHKRVAKAEAEAEAAAVDLNQCAAAIRQESIREEEERYIQTLAGMNEEVLRLLPQEIQDEQRRTARKPLDARQRVCAMCENQSEVCPGLVPIKVPADGRCFYHAAVFFLEQFEAQPGKRFVPDGTFYASEEDQQELRNQLARVLRSDCFDEDGKPVPLSYTHPLGLHSFEDRKVYISEVLTNPKQWGGDPELHALSQYLRRDVVMQANEHCHTFQFLGESELPPIHILYDDHEEARHFWAAVPLDQFCVAEPVRFKGRL